MILWSSILNIVMYNRYQLSLISSYNKGFLLPNEKGRSCKTVVCLEQIKRPDKAFSSMSNGVMAVVRVC